MIRSTNAALLAAITLTVVAGVACGSDRTPTAPHSVSGGAAVTAVASRAASASAHDLSGQWSYVEEATVTFQAPGTGTATTRCAGLAEGTYELTQAGESLSGTFIQTGNCTFGDGTVVENPIPEGSISNGAVRNGHVSFEQPGCSYRGTVSNDGATVSGNVVCKYDKEVKYIGKWTAMRI